MFTCCSRQASLILSLDLILNIRVRIQPIAGNESVNVPDDGHAGLKHVA